MLYKLRFNSVNEMRNYIASHKANGYYRNKELASEDDDKDFTGTENFAEADNLLQYGWTDGAANVVAHMSANKPTGQMMQFNRIHNYYGGGVSIGRYLTGAPKCRVTVRKAPTAAPVVDICYNMSVGAYTSTEAIQAATAKLLNVITGMEKNGIRVNLYVVKHGELKRNAEFICSIKIKDAGQPFNVLSVAYPLCHPSMQRRHSFALMERANIKDTHGMDAYSHVVTDIKRTAKALKEIGITPKNVLNYYEICDKSEAEIASMII